MAYEDIFEAASRLGGDVAKALEPARQWQARADELNSQLKAARAAEEREYAAAVESTVKSGRLPTPNGFGTWIYDSPASNLVVTSVATCHQNATAAATAAGPKLFEALQRHVSAIVAESIKLTMSLPERVNDEGAAIRASNGDRRHFQTWSRLSELIVAWEAAHHLNRLMMKAQWIPGPDHPRDKLGARTYMAYRHPLRLPTIKGPAGLQRHLAAAAAAGAEPGLYSWPDAVARWERLDRMQRNYSPGQVVTRFDGYGNTLSVDRGPESATEFAPAQGVS
jgi:hypothetical protein